MTPTSDQEARREAVEAIIRRKISGPMLACPDAKEAHQQDIREAATEIIALLAPVGLGNQEVSSSPERGEASAATPGEASSGGSSPRADQDEAIVTHIIVATDDLQDLLRAAYINGCEAVQANYHPYNEPEFGEAADDYVAGLDFTQTTKPYRTTPSVSDAFLDEDAQRSEQQIPPVVGREPEGWKLVPVEPTEAMLKAGNPETDIDNAAIVYRAMLSASPAPVSVGRGEEHD